MNEIYFLVRYTPFWAVPVAMIAGEFAYISWLRRRRKWLLACVILTLMALGALVYYYWAGGPEKSVKLLMKVVRFYSS